MLFTEWLNEAILENVNEPNAMCLSTSSGDRVHSRIVNLASYPGFVWTSNYKSHKALELNVNPMASLCFWWSKLGRQVRVEGIVTKVSDAEANELFHKHSRGQ